MSHLKHLKLIAKDPHTLIFSGTAKLTGAIGTGFQFLKTCFIVVTIIIGIVSEVCEVFESIMEDYKNRSCRNTIQAVGDCITTLLSFYAGRFVEAAIGTLIYPGILTGIFWILAGLGSEVALYIILELLELDIYSVDCEECGLNFECRRYEEGDQKKCEYCRNEKNE